ncbi:pantetheine-phosphate adenylyltransferase, partial [Brevibacterium sp.]|uniref:pantetheine-phosphate adenylyltransferase n=1 Tax=Brevibacterium sp. TaxID=1701 RepID=UPI0025BA16C7
GHRQLVGEVRAAAVGKGQGSGHRVADERAKGRSHRPLPARGTGGRPGGLLVDYCERIGAAAVLKGLRSGTDFAYELPMALMNRHLTELETVFIPGDPAYEHVSSSLVREVHGLGGDVSGLVPDGVLAALNALRG